MRLARVQTSAGPRYGRVEGDMVLLEGRVPGQCTALGLDDAPLLAPVIPSKILAIGRNYADHISEMRLEAPTEALSVFLKPPTSITHPGGSVVLPPPSTTRAVEHEAELAVVMGRAARNIAPADVSDHILGYTCANDVSARDLQRSDPHITRAKGFDTFCPLGPWIVTDADPSRGLVLSCRVNGQLRQRSTTNDMLVDVPTLISYLSTWTTLLPGDVILTGSPAGSGSLADGDQVEIEIESLGVLRHDVKAALDQGQM